MLSTRTPQQGPETSSGETILHAIAILDAAAARAPLSRDEHARCIQAANVLRQRFAPVQSPSAPPLAKPARKLEVVKPAPVTHEAPAAPHHHD